MTKEYRTTDIVLAAYLRINHYTMLNIEKQGQKGTFVFDNVDEEAIKTYFLGIAVVEPIAFNNAIKQLATSVKQL